MPYAVDDAFEKAMAARGSFRPKKFLSLIQKSMEKQIKNILRKRDIRTLPSPFASIFFHGSIENRRDASECVPYRNIGIHGAGSANAADALAAIRLTYEEEGTNGLKKLLEAKRRNFEGCEELRHRLHDEMPKVGNADAAVDSELRFLFDCFADAADKFSDDKRKIRPGSGSAM